MNFIYDDGDDDVGDNVGNDINNDVKNDVENMQAWSWTQYQTWCWP